MSFKLYLVRYRKELLSLDAIYIRKLFDLGIRSVCGCNGKSRAKLAMESQARVALETVGEASQ